MYHVQWSFPICGASFSANFRETRQWSVGTAVLSVFHSKIVYACYLAEYILSSLNSLVFPSLKV